MDIVGKTIQNGEPTPEHPVEIENKINILLAVQAIETVLSELEKKEAIINEMAEYIDKITFVDEKEDYGCDFQLLTNVMCNHNNCKECIKEYFTNKVEREGK